MEDSIMSAMTRRTFVGSTLAGAAVPVSSAAAEDALVHLAAEEDGAARDRRHEHDVVRVADARVREALQQPGARRGHRVPDAGDEGRAAPEDAAPTR